MRATLIGLVARLGSVALIGSGAAFAQDMAGDPEAGHRVANQCQSCHSLNGFGGSARTPRIGGQSAA